MPDDMPQIKWPDYKNDLRPWNAYRDGVTKIKDITSNEIFSFMQTHAFEGGQNSESTANSGILEQTLDQAKQSGEVKGLENAKNPADLTAAQKALVMRYYLNHAMQRIDGSKVLQDLPNREMAAALSDTLVRFGPYGGADMIRAALVKRMKQNGKAVPPDYETAKESRLGPHPFADLQELLKNKKEIGPFLEELKEQRDKKVAGTKNENGERKRNKHFRFEDLYP